VSGFQGGPPLARQEPRIEKVVKTLRRCFGESNDNHQ
jgi:hypothetical protein